MEHHQLSASKSKKPARNHNPEETIAFLESKGMRYTPQRQLVMDVLQRTQGHISAEEIHDQVREQFPKVNLSTVYRTLELLCDLGLMVEVINREDDRKRFEVVGEKPHHHLVCEDCGASVEVEETVIRQLKAEALKHYGFKLALNHFIGYGYCSGCNQKHQHIVLSDN